MKKLLVPFLLLAAFSVLADTPPPANTDHLKEGAVNLYSTSPRIDARITLQKGAANGLATLDGTGKVPVAQIPTGGGGGTWGSITGTLSDQTDLQSALNAKEPSISAGTTLQYWRGDKSFQTLNTLAVPELTNLYYTQARFDSAFSAKTTTNLTEGSNLYWTQGRFDTAFGLKSTTNLTEGSNLYYTQGRFDSAFSGKSTTNLSEGSNLYYTNARVDSEFDTRLATKSTTNLAEGTNLYFTDARALNAVFSRLNDIPNPDAEVDTSFWNLYNDSGRTVSAFVADQDITYTSTTSGGGGNGQTVSYQLGTSPYVEPPVITCPTGNSAVVKWYNGPTLSQNPTATVLKAAWDASCAATMATATITGTAANRQYQTGTVTLAQGGDTAPVDGTGGSPSGVTFTRTTSSPLVGIASFDLGKDASSEQGQGVSTDFAINSADRGNTLQISLYYSGSAAFVFGGSSDVQVFLYDKTNAVMLPLTRKTFTGTAGNVFRFAAQFTASATSTDYRLIFHIATVNASAWDLKFDSVTVNATLDASAATDVPKLMLNSQPINGSVTDHMAVMWTDGASAWVPATMASATDFTTLYGFATNLVGLTANITLRGALDGFSFGPFVGYNQYVDTTAGGISPLPASFTDAYVVMGKGLTSDTIMVEPRAFNRLITSKGGLLTNGGLNNGTGDVVVAGGTTGQFLRYNTALTNGFSAFTPVATSPIVYTASTSTWSLTTVPVASGGTGLTSTSQNFAFIGPTSGAGAPTWRLLTAGDIPTLNQNTTGSAAKWTTARTLAGNSVDGSANVAFSNKFIVQGTTDAGLSGAQFLGALATGLLKNTTTTGVLTAAAASDVTGQLLTGYVSGAGTVAATDSILQGIQKLNGNIGALTTSSISNSSGVTGTTATDALNNLNTSVQEVLLSAIKNAGSVTANTTIPTWTTTNRDTLTGFNSSTGVYTVAAAGDLLVNFTAATTTGTPLAQVYKNGALVQTGIGSGVRTNANVVVPNCVIGDTITVALDSSLTLTSTATDTVLNISQIAGATSKVVNARYHSATATVTSSLSDVSWTTSDFDSASAYSGTTYTVPTNGGGKYQISASLGVTATTVAAGNAQVFVLMKNGVEVSRNTFISGAATQKPAVLQISDFISVAAGDTLKFQVSSASTTPSISASTTQNYFYLFKMSN